MEVVKWLSLAVATFSLLVSLYTWRVTRKKREYEIADAILTDLLKIAIANPEFRDPIFIASAINGEDKTARYKYDAYATLVWNYLETLYDTYGEKLRESPFYGAMYIAGTTHKGWLFTDDRYSDYNPALLKFLKVK